MVLSSAKADLLEIQAYTLEIWSDVKVLELQDLIDDTFNPPLAFSPFVGRNTNGKNIYAKVLGKLPFIMMYTVDEKYIRITKVIHTERNR